MNEIRVRLEKLMVDLNEALRIFHDNLKKTNCTVQIYTHIDADGLSAGAILGKALYRANVPFQIRILKQLEREEIIKISKSFEDFENFVIFSDFGSGQYLELQKRFIIDENYVPFIILDHHLPQGVPSMEEDELIKEIHKKTSPWHINPYFYGINGSNEVSGAGICYYFARALNKNNKDLSSLAIIGAIGDIQNQGENKTFFGLNNLILEDAKEIDVVDVVDDLSFSSIKPLNEAIAYSYDIKLPGLSKNPNTTLKFLQTLGILMEKSDGEIRALNDLSTDEKQKVSTAIIEYASLKLDLEPTEIIKKLIVNKYVLKNEVVDSEIYDAYEFSNLLNSCGRTNNGSLGIAIAMGDRKKALQEGLYSRIEYRKSLRKAITWLAENEKVTQKEFIQYYFGEDMIPENIIGTIATMLIFDNSDIIDLNKPVFGLARREEEDVYKVSGRAHEKIVEKGINLSEAIRDALELTKLDALGGGHPPAAGTKIPVESFEEFLENINLVIEKQFKR